MLGEAMESEIREQPGSLRKNAGRYFEELCGGLAGIQPEMVLLAARGSSDHAALFARYLIEVHLGIPVSLSAPSVLTRYGTSIRYPNCLAIGISQSGAAPDVAEVLAAARAEGHRCLAITNTAGARIGGVADFELLMGVGVERSVAATKTYTASLLALYQLVRALQPSCAQADAGTSHPTPALPSLGAKMSAVEVSLPTDHWLEVCRVAAEEDAGEVCAGSPVFVLGRGFSFSTASEGALKLMECALIPAKAYSTADFEHGPRALAGPGSVVIVYGDAPNELKSQGAVLVRAPVPPGHVPEERAPIWQAFYAQWLALACARRIGLDPDRPRFLHKITETS